MSFLYAAILCDQIWWFRNNLIHKGLDSITIQLAAQIIKVFNSHIAAPQSLNAVRSDHCSPAAV